MTWLAMAFIWRILVQRDSCREQKVLEAFKDRFVMLSIVIVDRSQLVPYGKSAPRKRFIRLHEQRKLLPKIRLHGVPPQVLFDASGVGLRLVDIYALPFLVVFFDAADDAGWIAHRDRVRGNILSHDRAGPKNAVVTNRDAFEDHGLHANKHVVSYLDFAGRTNNFAKHIPQDMPIRPVREDRATARETDVVSDFNQRWSSRVDGDIPQTMPADALANLAALPPKPLREPTTARLRPAIFQGGSDPAH